MPTERFYNLPAEKKKVIRDAAIEEFNRVPLEKVSINRIIRLAGISRGSFYTYFLDKRDVLGCIFEDAADNLQNGWISCAQKNNGDLWKTAETFLQYSLINTEEKVLRLAENIVDSEKLFGITHDLCQEGKEEHYAMRKTMYDCIDTSEFRDTGVEIFGRVASMIFFELARCVSWYYHHPQDEEKIKKIFQEKLEILQYGIRKRHLES